MIRYEIPSLRVLTGVIFGATGSTCRRDLLIEPLIEPFIIAGLSLS